MASSQIRTLLGPSDAESSRTRTLDYLNDKLHSLQDLEASSDFQHDVDTSEARYNELKDQVRIQFMRAAYTFPNAQLPQLSSRNLKRT